MHLIAASLADFDRTGAAFEFAQIDFIREVRATATVFGGQAHFSAIEKIDEHNFLGSIAWPIAYRHERRIPAESMPPFARASEADPLAVSRTFERPKCRRSADT
jgi:hypothetical protein